MTLSDAPITISYQILTILFNKLPQQNISSLSVTCRTIFHSLGSLISKTYWFVYEPNKFKFLQPTRFFINIKCDSQLPTCASQITHLKIGEVALAPLLGTLQHFSNLCYLVLVRTPETDSGLIDCPPSFTLPPQLYHLQIDIVFSIPLQCLTSLPLKHLKLDQNITLSSLSLLPPSISTLHFGNTVWHLPPLDALYSALPLLRDLKWGAGCSQPASRIPPLSHLFFGGAGTLAPLLPDQVLPDTLTHISFQRGFTQQINHLLPRKLNYLFLGEHYENELTNLPPLLHTLIINSHSFSHNLDSLPQTLRKLKIGGSHLAARFNLPLHKLPPSLVKLQLIHMEKYTQEIKNLPLSLQKFILTTRGQGVNVTSLPSSLKYLFVSAETYSTNILRALPSSLHTLKLQGRVTKDTEVLLPPSLKVLKMINWEWEYPFAHLPPSLHTLLIFSPYECTQPFLLPPTVRNLTIVAPSFPRPTHPLPPLTTFRLHIVNSAPSLNEYLPPSLEHLSLPLSSLHTLSSLPANLLHLTIVSMRAFTYSKTSLQLFPQLPSSLARVTLSPFTHSSVLECLAPYRDHIVIRTGTNKQTVWKVMIKNRHH